uniref:Chromosome-associated polypeptide C n=1 Tax=Oryctolagus cuniculus TaxID=9986 RepID=A0A5F9CEA4_RABIT
MPRKGTQPSTARRRDEGPPPTPDGTGSDAEPEPPSGRAESPAAGAETPSEELDNRSLEEILNSIPPPPPPAMTNEAGAPRLMITHIVNQNFKSYAGEKILGPFHKRFSCIIGPNGSGKSNVIDSMLFVFGYRAQKIRSKKLSVLIHNSDEHKDIQSCTVEVHFQKIIDKEGDDYEVIPNSNFYVSRTAYRDNTSVYHISGKKKTFKDVGNLLRSHGIDLDHNRFLILQGEVEQIAMMKPKGQTEHDEGMLEYLEDIIGCGRLNEPIKILCRRVEILNEHRGEKLNRVKIVEKEKDALEGEKNIAIEFLKLENEIFRKKNHVCQYYMKLNKITKFIEENKEKFTQLDLEDVQVREKLKHATSKAKKLEKQLQKDKEKVEEFKSIPARSQNIITETTTRNSALEMEKEKEEEKLKEVMDSLKQETQGLQKEKENREKELMGFSKSVNEARSKMDVAQSELDIYLSGHNTAVSQLSKAKEALTAASETLKERKTAIKDIEAKLPQTERELKEKEKELQKLTQEEINFKSLVHDLFQKVEEAKSSLAMNRSRGKVLDAIIQEKKSGRIPGIYGRLGDLGAIDEKYDVAISSCCHALDYIVVDSIDTAQECVNFLKRHNIGVATFIGLDKMAVWAKKMNKIQTPENTPRLFDLVKVKDEEIRQAFYFALRDTLVTDNLDQATRVAYQKDRRWRVVTLQGQIIEQSGTMTGGGSRVMKGRMGSSVVVEISEEELNKMESQLQRDSKRAMQIQEQKVQLEEAVVKLRHSEREMRNTLEKFTASIQRLSEQEEYLNVQVKELEANVLATAPDKKKQKLLEENVSVFKREYDDVAEKAGTVEAEVKRLHSIIVEINNHKLKAQQDKLDKINKQLDECASAITKAQVAIKTADRNLKKAQESVIRTEKEIKDTEKEVEDLTAELKSLEDKATEVIKNTNTAEESLPEIQKEHRNLLQELKIIQENEHALQKDALSIKLKLEQIDGHIAEHNSKIKYWQKEVNFLNYFSVRPPKKSWKKIFNLSGGEKTLSSLALVFALHHYKPTPLYFMDEIDAALDFKNVSIVAFYIYEQTKNAQFIIISLRNNMFEISDRLIGIYKTYNITKSVAVNPKEIASKGLC